MLKKLYSLVLDNLIKAKDWVLGQSRPVKLGLAAGVVLTVLVVAQTCLGVTLLP